MAWSATDAALPELTENDAQYMLQRYFIAKARALTATAHARWTPEQFKKQRETIRQSLVKTLMLPPPAGKAQGISLGMTEVDSVTVERRVVRTRPGKVRWASSSTSGNASSTTCSHDRKSTQRGWARLA